MRQIFVEAKANHLASCTGLAKIIQRWHPVAAAYLAVMPGSIDSFLELPSCTEPLIRFAERHAEVYGFHLPLYYALEVMLRAFGFDRASTSAMPVRPFKQAPLNSRMIAQRDALEVQRDGEPFHRSVIPAAALIYGLIKADEEPGSAHRAAALQLRREFGLVPRVSGEYAESETYHLERLLTALCEGELSIAEFDASLHR
jgi:hypothetical protein